MQDESILKGQKILIVDDEPDILETLKELLDLCFVDTAPNFEAACKFLDKNTYDAVILDIMGVREYDLLHIANERGVPALMLTAHALSPDNLVQSIKGGARAYVPKDKITEIPAFLSDVLETVQRGVKDHRRWFERLKPFFDKKFGPEWRRKNEDFWKEFEETYTSRVSKNEMEKMM